MRPSLLLTFTLSLLSITIAQSTKAGRVELPANALSQPQRQAKTNDGPAGSKFEGHDGKSKTDGGAGAGTFFNGKAVPKATELANEDIEKLLKSGYWFVEFFSPYCGHCKTFAPTWQTLYEFYYTDDPLPQTIVGSDSDLSSFTNFYDFHFAKIDCVANADACAQRDVGSYPTIKLYKDGKEIESKVGAKPLDALSVWIESILEAVRPGSRQPGGPKLPVVGENHVDDPHKPPPALTKAVPPAVQSALAATPLSATALSATRAASHSTETPNPLGKSVPLAAESFQHLVTTSSDPWFIKFYAPWCHHCQALAPNWHEMARQMKGQLNVGEVNCEVEKRLCKDVRIKGYPTLLFFRGGERIEYQGLRGLGDLISFATKTIAVGEGVRDVTAADFEALEEKEEVLFLYFYDQATTSEDFATLDRLVMSLIGHAKLVKTKDPALAQRFKISTWPRLLVSRDGKPTYYIGLSPRDMRDYRRVLAWMQTVWLPIVPELTAANAREIMDDRLVVLGVLSRDRPEDFVIAKREIKNAALEWIDKQTQAFQLERQELRDAKQLRIEEAEDRNDQRSLRAAKSIRINMDDVERRDVGFAWVDGVFWERWVRTTYGISPGDGDRVVVADDANKRYWDTTMTGNPIVPSRTSILETLPRIIANPPKIPHKSTTTPLGHLWWIIRGGLVHHPILSAGVFLAMLLVGALSGRKYVRRRNGGFIRLGEKGGHMDGLLNGDPMSQGKVD